MNNENFNDPFTALLFGVDDEKMEDIDLQEAIDKAIRNKIASDDMTEDEIVAKLAKTKMRLANFISQGDKVLMNPLFFMLGMFGLSDNMLSDGVRGLFADKDGNTIPEDVFKNEYLPLAQKSAKISVIVQGIEQLTEESSFGRNVPNIIGNLFNCKDDLLDLLKGHKSWLESEMDKIATPYLKKDLDKSK